MPRSSRETLLHTPKDVDETPQLMKTKKAEEVKNPQSSPVQGEEEEVLWESSRGRRPPGERDDDDAKKTETRGEILGQVLKEKRRRKRRRRRSDGRDDKRHEEEEATTTTTTTTTTLDSSGGGGSDDCFTGGDAKKVAWESNRWPRRSQGTNGVRRNSRRKTWRKFWDGAKRSEKEVELLVKFKKRRISTRDGFEILRQKQRLTQLFIQHPKSDAYRETNTESASVDVPKDSMEMDKIVAVGNLAHCTRVSGKA